MCRTFAPLYLIVLCCVVGMVLYASSEMSKVADLIKPFDEAPPEEEAPVPLEEAAPEAIRHKEGFRTLVARARFVASAGQDRTGQYPEVRGKALLWDGTANDLSEVHGLLPADVRAPSPSGEVAVFLITSQERRPFVNYNFDPFSGGGPAGVQGFRTDTVLSVVAMPDQRPLGRFRVYGADPPSATRLRPGQTEVDGNWKGPLAYWVESCVRGPKWREQQRFPKIPADHEAFARLAEQASELLPQCQAKGASGLIPQLPAKALIWHWQPKVLLNHLSLAHHRLPADLQAGPSDTAVTVVLVIGHKYVREHFGAPPEQDVDRNDYTVAVVAMPSRQSVGVFTVRGEEWPAERRRLKGDGPDEHEALARWVADFVRSRQSGPRQAR